MGLRELLELGLDDLRRTEDSLIIRSIMGAVALAKGEIKLGALLTHAAESEISEILEEHLAWSELYSVR